MRLAILAAVCLLLVPPAAAVPERPNDAPFADAGLDRTVRAGETVLLDGGGSLDPDGRLVRYEWRVETPDGGSVDLAAPTDPTTRFRPTTLGRYTVTLTVEDDDGATRTDSLFVDVRAGPETDAKPTDGSNDPPTGRLDGPASVVRGQPTGFRANASDPDGHVVSYEWAGGETGRTVDLTFDRPNGTEVPVSVTVTDDDGDTLRLNRTVRVRAPPTGEDGDGDGGASNLAPDAFLEGPDRVAVGETATYSLVADDPDGTVARAEWSLPRTAAGRTLTHTFSDAGTHTVRVTVVDDDGATETVAETVEVSAAGPPVVSLSGPDTAPNGSVQSYRVEAFDPDGGEVTVSWSPDRAGGGSRFENRVRMPDDPGSTVDVSVTVTDDEGDSTTASERVAVTGSDVPAGSLPNGTVEVSEPRLFLVVPDENHQTSTEDTIEHGSYLLSAAVGGTPDGPVTTTWRFDDGATATDVLDSGDARSTVRHMFPSNTSNGSHALRTISVTATDAAGNSDTERVTRSVRTVTAHEHVRLHGSAAGDATTNGTLTVEAGTPITFRSNPLQSFRVEYGDGSVMEFPRTPYTTEFSYVYDRAGTYTVQLTTSHGPKGYGLARITVRVTGPTDSDAAVATPR